MRSTRPCGPTHPKSPALLSRDTRRLAMLWPRRRNDPGRRPRIGRDVLHFRGEGVVAADGRPVQALRHGLTRESGVAQQIEVGLLQILGSASRRIRTAAISSATLFTRRRPSASVRHASRPSAPKLTAFGLRLNSSAGTEVSFVLQKVS